MASSNVVDELLVQADEQNDQEEEGEADQPSTIRSTDREKGLTRRVRELRTRVFGEKIRE